MWYGGVITEAATGLPVSLDEVKSRLYVDFGDDDELIYGLISEVADRIERRCLIRLMPQTIIVKCDYFSDFARVPEGPLSDSAVQAITYVDAEGSNQTLAASVYELRPNGIDAAIILKFSQAWPPIQSGSRISVELVAGYETIPPEIKTAIQIGVAELYENRQDRASADWSLFDQLLVNFKR